MVVAHSIALLHVAVSLRRYAVTMDLSVDVRQIVRRKAGKDETLGAVPTLSAIAVPFTPYHGLAITINVLAPGDDLAVRALGLRGVQVAAEDARVRSDTRQLRVETLERLDFLPAVPRAIGQVD